MTLRRSITFGLTVILLNPVWAAPLLARSRGGWMRYSPSQLQSALRTLCTGPDARVAGMRLDKTRFSGYLYQFEPSRFLLRDDETGDVLPISYAEVRELRGENAVQGIQFAVRLSRAQFPGQTRGDEYCSSHPKGELIAMIGGLAFLAIAIILLASDKS